MELMDKELMISEEELIIKVLNDSPAEYSVILNGFES